MTSRQKESDEDIKRDFNVLVNMSAQKLADWLETEESKSVGWHHEGHHESICHQSGGTSSKSSEAAAASPKTTMPTCARSSRTFKRRLAQRPHHEVEHTRWRYSLMNWGHDPLKG
jgi:hypothetical protein